MPLNGFKQCNSLINRDIIYNKHIHFVVYILSLDYQLGGIIDAIRKRGGRRADAHKF